MRTKTLGSLRKLLSVTERPMSRESFVVGSGTWGGGVALTLLLLFGLYQSGTFLWMWLSGPNREIVWPPFHSTEPSLLALVCAGASILSIAAQWLRRHATTRPWRACLTSTEKLTNNLAYMLLGAWFYSQYQKGDWSWFWLVGWGVGMFVGRWRQAAHESAN